MNYSEGRYTISVPEAARRLGISRSVRVPVCEPRRAAECALRTRIAVPRQELEWLIRSAVRDWNDARGERR
jgi:hypothetical protein